MGVQCGGAGLPRRDGPSLKVGLELDSHGLADGIVKKNFLVKILWPLLGGFYTKRPSRNLFSTFATQRKEGKNAPDNRKNLNPIFITYKTNE